MSKLAIAFGSLVFVIFELTLLWKAQTTPLSLAIGTMAALIIGILSLFVWELGGQILGKQRKCAECGAMFVWRRNKEQILCNKCQDFVDARQRYSR